uniref:Uncharacterized protein n=1 Tax=Rhizophora mucronata TaxID=61149 RepID=A0A2P2NNZ1_RHIMU
MRRSDDVGHPEWLFLRIHLGYGQSSRRCISEADILNF